MPSLIDRPLAAMSTALALVGVLGSSGCANIDGCNLGGCRTRLVLAVRESGGARIAPGLWEFQFVFDGVESPPIPCEVAADSSRVQCEVPDELSLAINPIIVDNPNNPVTILQIVASRGSGANEHELPEVAVVTAEHDGAVVMNQRLEPNYAPPDPGCEAVCVEDLIELTVDRN